MLAINHVSFATAAALGASLYFNQPFFLPLIVFVIFAALLPDIDHRNSEVSQLIPVIHRFFGHRGFTHSILGIVSFTFLSYSILKPNVYITYTLLFAGFVGIYYLHKLLIQRTKEIDHLTTGFFSKKQLRLFVHIATLVLFLMAIVAAFTVWNDVARNEMFILLVFGYISHIFGDWITREGIPLLWPWKKFFGLRLFRTGGGFEKFLGIVLIVVNIYLTYLFWNHFHLFEKSYWEEFIALL